MKKIYIYSSIIIIIGLSFLAWDFYQISDRISNDHHYTKKSTFDFINAEKNDFCIIKDAKNKISYFRIEGFTSDHKLCVRYGNQPSLIPLEELEKIIFSSNGTQIHISQRWVSNIYNEPDAWKKDLSIISQGEIEQININNKVYCYSGHDHTGKMPDPIYLIPLNLLLLLGLTLLILVVLSLNDYISSKRNIITYISIISASFLVAHFFSVSNFSTLFYVFLVKNLITFLLLYHLIKLVNNKTKMFDFGKKEFVKFLCISTFGFFSELFGGRLFNFIYFDFLEFGGGTMYEFGNFSNVLGWFKFWIYFAVANFMSNLTSYIIALRKQEKIFKLQKSEGTLASSSLASIQSRINPHFLYNALNSIASLARTEPRKTEEMALQLAKFYDQCSEIKSKPLVTISEELEILKSYLKIEKIRFGDRIQVALPTDDDVMKYMIPSFTLQPIVENAIKYGYNPQTNSIDIRISALVDNGKLTIRVYDGGPPFSNDMHSGYGLNSIAKKLKVLYPDGHVISFVNEPDKCVEIILKANIV
ncbi:MAG TPA: histidine kinase [Saprospiraceae bacterium]|nr:histidine kinase [Saprospiraceae bacterium]HMU03082.1 histidine kinase [Saprospiraceae bacterium]